MSRCVVVHPSSDLLQLQNQFVYSVSQISEVEMKSTQKYNELMCVLHFNEFIEKDEKNRKENYCRRNEVPFHSFLHE